MGAPGTTPGEWGWTGSHRLWASPKGATYSENILVIKDPVWQPRNEADKNQIAASPALYDALAASLRILRTFLGRGTAGGSCGLCGSTWHGDDETHGSECPIAVATAALAKARGEA